MAGLNFTVDGKKYYSPTGVKYDAIQEGQTGYVAPTVPATPPAPVNAPSSSGSYQRVTGTNDVYDVSSGQPRYVSYEEALKNNLFNPGVIQNVSAISGLAPTPIKIDVTNPIPSDVYSSTPKSYLDVQNLIDENKKLYDTKLAEINTSRTNAANELTNALQLTPEEKALQARQLQLQQEQEGRIQQVQERPLTGTVLSSGIANEIANIQSGQTVESLQNLREQTFNTQKQTLLATQRQNAIEVAKAKLSSVDATADDFFKAQQLINQETNDIIARANTLQDNARQTLAVILDKTVGVTFDQLSPATAAQIGAVAQQAGIPLELLTRAMKVNADQLAVENAQKQYQLQTQRYSATKTSGGSGGGVGTGIVIPTGGDMSRISDLNTALQFAVSGLTKDQRNNAINTFNNFVRSGKTQEAQQYVERLLGNQLSSTQKEEVSTMGTVSQLANQLLQFAADGKLEGIGGAYYGTFANALDSVFGGSSDEARKVRILIGNIKGTIAKLRGGTSFTPNEEVLLDSYTPTINENSAVALEKLRQLQSFIENKRQAVLYGGQAQVFNRGSQNIDTLDSVKSNYGITY